MPQWPAAIAALMEFEGGEANRPLSDDPGGWTRYGITFRRWMASERSVEDFEALDRAGAEDWFRTEIWDKIPFYRIKDHRFAVLLFNWAAGPLGEPRAIKTAQAATNRLGDKNLIEDGILGSKTLEAINDCENLAALAMLFKVEVALYLITRPHFRNNLGWMERLDRL